MNSWLEMDNLETFTLIWLTSEENVAEDFHEVEEQFRAIINYLVVFHDYQQCLQYIQTRTKHDRLIAIVDMKWTREILHHIIHLEHLLSIYVYTDKTKNVEHDLNNVGKVNIHCSVRSRDIFESKGLFRRQIKKFIRLTYVY
jgi:hypothetical protein